MPWFLLFHPPHSWKKVSTAVASMAHIKWGNYIPRWMYHELSCASLNVKRKEISHPWKRCGRRLAMGATGMVHIKEITFLWWMTSTETPYTCVWAAAEMVQRLCKSHSSDEATVKSQDVTSDNSKLLSWTCEISCICVFVVPKTQQDCCVLLKVGPKTKHWKQMLLWERQKKVFVYENHRFMPWGIYIHATMGA